MQLVQAYTAKDVKQAMFSINENKSPRPNSYGSGFFRAAWKVIGNNVCDVILEFMSNRKMLKQLNTTMISIIPKVAKPEFAMSDTRATFVKGRSLVHNVLMCHDILRRYNRKNSSARCLMKIDLRKSYDMVKWEFVEEMLEGYGFPDKFIQLVMVCINTTRFSVKVNEEGCGYFEGRRGLRQEDPISPQLLVLLMDYLSRILRKMSQLPDF
ncbi:uncharacterized protein LOC132035028 [Lycium ferocissimum]|uniref:uncharacterized protein LOC132035028 n=1 Tax=Lycium ferocissimum TaxID=112874 RepID=UPI00281660CC|nr:uncharacterized protein LOC132035028 [Lycium ferocissimum]